MKTYSIFKVALAALFLSTIVIIGCSKTALNSGNELLGSGFSSTSANEPGGGSRKFQECPDVSYRVITEGRDTVIWFFSGKIVGLGNAGGQDNLRIDAYIEVTPECYNPSGNGKVVPGQSKMFKRSVCGKLYDLTNGRFEFNENTTPILASDFGKICPNDKWTVRIKDAQLRAWHIFVNEEEVTNSIGNISCNSPDPNGFTPCSEDNN